MSENRTQQARCDSSRVAQPSSARAGAPREGARKPARREGNARPEDRRSPGSRFTPRRSAQTRRRSGGPRLDRSGLPRPAARRRNRRRSPRSASRAGRAATSTSSRTRPEVHNLVVCTLCSCYPHTLLGIPPNWYKTAAYRARAVREPRSVIAEFGEAIPDEVEVRVLGLDRGSALPRAARAAGQHRGLGRRAARLPRHPQFDDRHRARSGRRIGSSLMDGIHDLGGKQGYGPIDVGEPDEPFHRRGRRGSSASSAHTRGRPRQHRLVPHHPRKHRARPIPTRPYYDQWLRPTTR